MAIRKKKNISIQKQSIPSTTGERRFEVLLEQVESDFSTFGEALQMLGQKVDQRFDAVDQRFDAVDQRFDGIDNELSVIKTELSLIRHELKQKVDRDEFKLLETRVARLEMARNK
jgi:hypothetical protein